MPLDEHEKRAILAWIAHVADTIPLVLETTRDRRSAALQAFARDLTALAPQIALDHVSRETDDVPGFFLGHGWIWHAIPSGAELRPFLEILAVLGEQSTPTEKAMGSRGVRRNPHAPSELMELLQNLQTPQELEVFTTPQCPHCAHMLLELVPAPFVASSLVIRVIDAALFPQRAKEAGIRSVPTVLFGKDFRWTGRVDITHIFEVVCRKDHTGLSSAAAIRLLKEGKAPELARLILASPTTWTDFAAVLTHPDWSVRLGALVVLEELSEKDPKKVSEYLPPLWEKMEAFPPAVQGDVLYATGIVGDASWKGRVLQWALQNAHDPELVEAAEEALAKLEAAPCR